MKTVYEEAALKIVTPNDPKVIVTITLTSPVMREGEDNVEPGTCFLSIFCNHGVLNKSLLKCNIANSVLLFFISFWPLNECYFLGLINRSKLCSFSVEFCF